MARRIRYTAHPGPAIKVIGPIADQAAYRAAVKMRTRVEKNIRAKGRIDTGQMIRGVQARKLGRAGYTASYLVSSSAPHTIFQEYGTRAHGPRVAKVMVFTPKGSNKVVFAKWVRGVKPGHFFRDALRDARAADAEP